MGDPMSNCCNHYLAGVALVSVLTTIFVFRRFRKKVDTSGYPVDKVTHFQFSRGTWCPSISPFPLKFETYLRWTGIPYVNDCDSKMSFKQKIPWMIYKGEIISDSQLCIDHLNQDRGIDLSSHLTQEERAVARALQKMTEENLYWAMCAWTFQDDLQYLRAVLPYKGIKLWLVSRILRRLIRRELWGQGMGRHTLQEAINFGLGDLRALSAFLGKKPFFMGDQPCEADCAIFGMLAMIKWAMPRSPYQAAMKDEMTNLSEYCDRMKERFWPDWDECITKDGTQEAKV